MKRRTRLISIGCAIVGTFPIAAHAASASTNEPPSVLTFERPSPSLLASVPTPRRVLVVRPKAVPQKVHAPLPSVTVKSGDTLSGIGVRTSRTWEQLASYNHIPNPNLIYTDEIVNIPPASYVPAQVGESSGDPEASTTTAVTPTAQPSTADTSAAQSSSGQTSGIWGCIAYHESGGNPGTNTGNGYYGMYQDTQSSWVSGGGLAYAPRADLASAAAQTAVNERIQAQQGWGAWPETSVMCGA
jgi:LysM repeat protein